MGGGESTINALKSDWNSLYIAGEWVNRGSRPAIEDHNPYTGKVITEVPSATAEDVDKAFKAAERVQR
mgnify:CR=1 FL=1